MRGLCKREESSEAERLSMGVFCPRRVGIPAVGTEKGMNCELGCGPGTGPTVAGISWAAIGVQMQFAKTKAKSRAKAELLDFGTNENSANLSSICNDVPSGIR